MLEKSDLDKIFAFANDMSWGTETPYLGTLIKNLVREYDVLKENACVCADISAVYSSYADDGE